MTMDCLVSVSMNESSARRGPDSGSFPLRLALQSLMPHPSLCSRDAQHGRKGRSSAHTTEDPIVTITHNYYYVDGIRCHSTKFTMVANTFLEGKHLSAWLCSLQYLPCSISMWTIQQEERTQHAINEN